MQATTPQRLFAIGILILIFAGLTRAGQPPRPVASANYQPSPQELEASYQRAQRGGATGRAYKTQLTPNWFANGTRFWYRNDLRGGTREFILVDAEKGTRQPAFDHQKLAAGLSKAAGTEYKSDRLPFDSVEFVNEHKAVHFKVGTTTWTCELGSYECTKRSEDRNQESGIRNPGADGTDRNVCATEEAPDVERAVAQQRPRGQEPDRPARAPDGKWTAFIKEDNVFLRAEDGKETQLSKDGKAGLAYGMLQWSPDSKTLIACRIEPGENKEVYLVESSPRGGGRAKMATRPYPLPGDKFTAYELNLFDIATQKQTKAEVDRIDFGRPQLRWRPDGRHFTYQKTDRGHQRFRLIEVDADTGKSRNLIDEQTQTFVWTAHTENVGLTAVTFFDKTEELLYVSERDGWRHLYLIDAKTGQLKNQITKGEFVVRGIERIDEIGRQIWFRACGKHADQDPYFIHFYRVNFDGTELVALTEGNGTHTLAYAPERKYVIDSYSRVDMATVHELRRVADGKLVCPLEKADTSELVENGWQPPEVFVAKGRDGKTDIWGIITRPRNFDANKKYPVIESIYAGPQGSFVPKAFSTGNRYATLTELGFIVVQMDGMGTANRSKAFHDVCWHNLKDAGFPDRILWHRAVAKKYAYYDISRVGIYGGSAGGQNATGALLFHPEFYKVAVSDCGCHDNRMDKASWNEQWMGYPVGPHFAACSNIDNAHRLKGKLLLTVGELDTNVPPESTYRLCDALIKAGKDFDFILVPGAGHGAGGGTYSRRRLQDFFVRHLHGVTPPERNAVAGLDPIKLHAEEKSGARSQSNTSATTMAFINKRGQPVKVWWLDFEGNRVLYETLGDGGTYQLGTFLTHPWVITDEQDRALEVHYPTAAAKTVTITKQPANGGR